MPPIGTTKLSRLRFLDLDPLLADLRREGTAFMPEAVQVLRTEKDNFLDEGFIESVHFAKFGCPEMFDDGVSNFGSNVSRATVTFEVDPTKPDCALPVPEDAITVLNMNQRCKRLIVPTEIISDFDFEPRCMVLVLAPESEYVMFNEMLSAGRNMAEPFRISVNFTVATGETPDVKIANTNCHNGRVLAANYELDRTGQDELDELEATRNSITIYTELIEFTKHVRDSQALVSIDPATGKATLLPDPPPPPPPPPPTPGGPDGAPAPPAPPSLVSLDRQVAIYEEEKLAFERREAELVAHLEDCVVGDRAKGVVCGKSKNEAPNPWLALDGVRCRGYATQQTREKDYCGFWLSDVNPLAADTDLRIELLEAGPFCIAESGEPAVCSSNASRTQRSGVYDLEYMARDDRLFCEFQFARERLTPETATEIDAVELCRANLTQRLEHCALECDTCKAECESPAARAATSAYRCTVGFPTVGMTAAFHSSDIGQVRKNAILNLLVRPRTPHRLCARRRTSRTDTDPFARSSGRPPPTSRGKSSSTRWSTTRSTAPSRRGIPSRVGAPIVNRARAGTGRRSRPTASRSSGRASWSAATRTWIATVGVEVTKTQL